MTALHLWALAFAIAALAGLALSWAIERHISRGEQSVPWPARPRVPGTLPVIPGCRDCPLAREAGYPTQARHLVNAHAYVFLS